MTRSPRRRGSLLLLAATLASLILTIAAGYVTRLSLVEASWWVTHTDEVKLAIADCERALDHGDSVPLSLSMANVQRLTVDNARQQQNVARASLLAEQGSRSALEELFASMQREEDRLMTERSQQIASARWWSSAAFIVGALLTVLFGAGAFALLRAQGQELARQRALLEAILESVEEGIIATEASRSTIAMNAVARSIVGRSFPRDHLPDDWGAHIRATFEDGSAMQPKDGPLARALCGEIVEDVVYRIVPATGPSTEAGVWVSTTARPIRDESGRVIAAVATLRDITEQRATAERLRDLSSTDELTGLLNRRGFLANAANRIATARSTKAPVALVFADVNGLKRINDELGHERAGA
jgi:PAS domain-containing protein